MKRLKNIEDKSGEHQKMIESKKDNQLGIKAVTYILDEELSQEAKNMLVRFSNQEKIIEYKKFDYRSLKELFKAIYSRILPLDEAKRIQDKYEGQLAALERYRPRNSDYKTKREQFLNNARRREKMREKREERIMKEER